MRKFNVKGFTVVEVVFLLLILAAIGLGGWYVGTRHTQKAKTTTTSSQSTAPTKDPAEKTQVTDAEVTAASAAQDCIKLADQAYDEDTDPTPETSPGDFVTTTFNKVTLKSINLNTNTLTVTQGQSTTNYVRWSDLPTVYDKQCNKIKFSAIKAGDSLKLYFRQDSSTSKEVDVLFIIQRL